MKVGVIGGSKLAEDYVRAASSLDPFYGASYRAPGSFRTRAEHLDSRFGQHGREEVAVLLESCGVEQDQIRRWVEGRGYVVTTGQQPGLFGGPLYSLYKGLSAIAAARALEQELHRPVLPLFWIASEDHDWDEAGTIKVLDSKNRLSQVTLEVEEEHRHRPIFRVPLSEEIDQVLEAFLSLHPDTDFSSDLHEMLRSGFRRGRTLSDGFQAFIETHLGPLGLHVVPAHDPVLKERSRPMLLRELDAAEERETELNRTADELSKLGYSIQVPILPGGVNIFFEGPAGRERLYRDGPGTFHLRHSGERVTRGEVEEAAARDPSVLSPNVLLRPVVENSLFPVLGYVAGPGEIQYYSQLRPVFEGHDLEMPIVLPRHSVTLVERKIGKVLDKFALDLEQLSRPHHELAAELTREEMPEDIRKTLEGLRARVHEAGDELLQGVQSIDATLAGPVEHARNQTFQSFEEVEKKILQALKRQNEIALAQVEKAQIHLFPEGKPQERVLNPVYYLVRYGPDLVRHLLDAFEAAPPTPFVPEQST